MPQQESQGAVATIGRSQGTVYLLPHTVESIPEFLGAALERIAPGSSAVQVLIVTADAESALAMSEAAHRMNGATGIEVLPVTSSRRAGRLLKARPVRAIAGTAEELLALVSGSQLKLEELTTIVVAWLEDILDSGERAAASLENLISESGKDAERIIVARKSDARLEEFVERYARRARRVMGAADEGLAGPTAVRYVTTAAVAKPAIFRRLLDELDPPSAAIVVRSAVGEIEAKRVLQTLGYPEDGSIVRLVRGAIEGPVNTVIYYEAPARRGELASVAAATPVEVLALVLPSELPVLREIVGGGLSAYNFSTAASKLNRRDDALRKELRSVLAAGVPPREIAPLEPLLAEYDAVEIAAAALQLLERERRISKTAVTATAAPAPPADPAAPRPERDRPRPGRDNERAGERPRPGGRPFRSDGPRSDRPRSDRPRLDGARSGRPRSDAGRDRNDRRPRPGQDRSDRGRSAPPRGDRPRSDRPRPGPPRSGPPRGRPGR